MSPPTENRRPHKEDGDQETRRPSDVTASITQDADVPVHRPWARRKDARDVERRFRIDRAGWRRRIDCARRTSHDGTDQAAPYHGRWTR